MTKHAPLPWRLKEMTSTIVIRSADGRTVCNLPVQADKKRRRANAELIVAAVNALFKMRSRPMRRRIWISENALKLYVFLLRVRATSVGLRRADASRDARDVRRDFSINV